MRHEWRNLSREQQHDYINAAQCLQHTPSKLHTGMSLYDDFPFLHDVVGDYGMYRHFSISCQLTVFYAAHETAAFLTWHRYFIHLYEVTLKERCGYTGPLP
jgi:tyrosinase